MKRAAMTLAIVLFVAFAATAADINLNWFAINAPPGVGAGALIEDDNVGGTPTASFFTIPGSTTVTFTHMYFHVTTADTTGCTAPPATTGCTDFYDIAILGCTNNDCSQGSQTPTVLCNLGTTTQGVALPATGNYVLPCGSTQGINGTVTLNPGTYILMGVGNAKIAACKGLGGLAPILPVVLSGVTNSTGSATGIGNGPWVLGAPTNHSPANACTVSVH
jgi:hypothetical protein